MEELLGSLRQVGASVQLDGDQLRVTAPKGALTPQLREALQANKQQLIEHLRQAHVAPAAKVLLQPQSDQRYEPFPLTDVQHAYWTGRQRALALSGVSTHFYVELESTGLDLPRLEQALNRLIERHDMLRAVVQPDGLQRVLPSVPPYRIHTLDLRAQPAAEREAALLALRERMSHQVLPGDRAPLFEVCAARLGDSLLRLFVSWDLLVVDGSSIMLLFEQWRMFYEQPDAALPPLALRFRDVVMAGQTARDSAVYERARDYWHARLDDLPAAPQLPLAVPPHTLGRPRFERRRGVLPMPVWSTLKERARRTGLTASALLLTAFSEVLQAWSRKPAFTLNLTLFHRPAVHPQIEDVVGDFTTLSLLAVQPVAYETLAVRAGRLQRQLARDIEHVQYGGVQVLRDLARRQHQGVGDGMPVVFTSALVLGTTDGRADAMDFFGESPYGISQTPQVWFDHQVFERRGRLVFDWDTVQGLFPPGMLDDMFEAYMGLLQRLADDDAAGQSAQLVALPAWQQDERQRANATQADLPPSMLHALVAEQALRRPDATAVIAGDEHVSYRMLSEHANRLAHRLRAAGVRPNTLVGVSLDKGWHQVAAVLGVLHAGAAYLPIDPALPHERRALLAREGALRFVVGDASQGWPEGIEPIALDDARTLQCATDPLPPVQGVDDLAYVIFTSGSTGTPKGVAVTHRAAANTVQDINTRFGVTEADRVLALSSLSFDLSVYDFFGVLGAGGTVVMPDASRHLDPLHWGELMQRHGVTLWNSVPALMQIWADGLPACAAQAQTLRLVLLSGDWIPVSLPDRLRAHLPGLSIISLGGATEAAIWSVFHPIGEVPPHWTRIPYGKPLANQRLHVLNEWLQPCPVWTVGEIFIGGAGLAQGYWQDPERTRERFIVHPGTGERLYRTGDLGRYLPGGDIDFLGREDGQVKINGHRIELGEVGAQLRRLPGVRHAWAVVSEGASRQLVAYAVPQGAEVRPDDLIRALGERLPAWMVPGRIVLLDEMPLTSNGKVDVHALPALESEAAPPRDTVAPRNALEQRLHDVWHAVLPVKHFGVEDNFFDLGGDSLIAVQVVARMHEEFHLSGALRDDLMRVLLEQPRIDAIAGFLASAPPPDEWNALVQSGVDALRQASVQHAADSRAFDAVWHQAAAASPLVMAHTLARLGVFVRAGEQHRLEDLPRACGIEARQRPLLRQWLDVLVAQGWLERCADATYRALQPFDETVLSQRIDEAVRAWPPHVPGAAAFGYVKHCAARQVDLLRGTLNPLELLFPGGSWDVVDGLYRDAPPARLCGIAAAAVLSSLARCTPLQQPLRILEVGAGSGATTGAVLPALPPQRTRYHHTDVTAFFRARAAQRFAAYPFVEYGLFDMNRDPSSQGLGPQGFDAVVAVNALHNATDLPATLRWLASLLRPGGVLLLGECTRNDAVHLLTLGHLESWGHAAGGEREVTPMRSAAQWREALLAAGFARFALVSDEPEPSNALAQCLMLAQT